MALVNNSQNQERGLLSLPRFGNSDMGGLKASVPVNLLEPIDRGFVGNLVKDVEEFVVGIPSFVRLMWDGAVEWTDDPARTWNALWGEPGGEAIGLIADGFREQYTNEEGNIDLGHAFYTRPFSTFLDATVLLDLGGLAIRSSSLAVKALGGSEKAILAIDRIGIAISRAPSRAVGFLFKQGPGRLLRTVPPTNKARLFFENLGINLFQDETWRATSKSLSDLETETFTLQSRMIREHLTPGISDERWNLVEKAARTPEAIRAQKIRRAERHIPGPEKAGTFWKKLNGPEKEAARELQRLSRSWEETLKSRGTLPELTRFSQWGEAVRLDPAVQKIVRERFGLNKRQMKRFYSLSEGLKEDIVSYLKDFMDPPAYFPLYRKGGVTLGEELEKIGVSRPSKIAPGELKTRTGKLIRTESLTGKQLFVRFIERRAKLVKLVEHLPKLREAMKAVEWDGKAVLPKGHVYFPVDLMIKVFTDDSKATRSLLEHITAGKKFLTEKDYIQAMEKTLGEILKDPRFPSILEDLSVSQRAAIGRIWIVPRGAYLEATRRLIGSYPSLLGRAFTSVTDLYKVTVLAFALGPWYVVQNVVGGGLLYFLSGGTPLGLFRAAGNRWNTLLPDKLRFHLRNVMIDIDTKGGIQVGRIGKTVERLFLLKVARNFVDFANRVDGFFRKATFLDTVEREARRALIKSGGKAFFSSLASSTAAMDLLATTLKDARIFDRWKRGVNFLSHQIAQKEAQISLMEKEYLVLRREFGGVRREGRVPPQRELLEPPGKIRREKEALTQMIDIEQRITALKADLHKGPRSLYTRQAALDARFINKEKLQTAQKHVLEAIQHSEDFLFNYFRMNWAEKRWVKNIVPFWAWFRNINMLFAKLPFIAPWRTFMWNRMAQVAWDTYDDPEKPDWLMNYVPVGVDEHGHFVWLPTRTLNPFASVIDVQNLERGIINRSHFAIQTALEFVSGRPVFRKIPPEVGVYGTPLGEIYEHDPISSTFRARPHLSLYGVGHLTRSFLSNFYPYAVLEELIRPYTRDERNAIPDPEAVRNAEGQPFIPLWAQRILRATGTKLVTDPSFAARQRREVFSKRELRGSVLRSIRRAEELGETMKAEWLRKVLRDLFAQPFEDF